MRTDTWQEDFWTAIAAARGKEFDWGTHDCVLFATSMIDVISGTTYLSQAQTRFPYSSKDEALALISANGGITGLVESFLGADTHVNWGQATQGDIVLVNPIPFVTDMESLCVHDGTQLVGPALSGGLASVPLRFAAYAWLIR